MKSGLFVGGLVIGLILLILGLVVVGALITGYAVVFLMEMLFAGAFISRGLSLMTYFWIGLAIYFVVPGAAVVQKGVGACKDKVAEAED